MKQLVDTLRVVIEALIAEGSPITVAIDGPSGAGKSTIANALAGILPATIVPSDDFFAAQITSVEWDARTPVERSRDAMDWMRLRELALEPLRAGRPAAWRPFDFAAAERSDGTYAMSNRVEKREPASVILLDGAYSARPELADLLDLCILIDTPEAMRLARLEARESAEFLRAWHDRWDAAEAYYFRHVRPASSFDLVVDTLSTIVRDQRPRATPG